MSHQKKYRSGNYGSIIIKRFFPWKNSIGERENYFGERENQFREWEISFGEWENLLGE